jgi:EAL domain-containing protein (putative c-di-GMP-specific phosphodiesterase class I)
MSLLHAEAAYDTGRPSSPLDQVLTRHGVRTLFQPVVDLDSGGPVAFEALTRGPVGSALERPDHLFEAARAEGRLAELDDLCRSTALRTARAGGLRAPYRLLINAEPAALDRWCPQQVDASLDPAFEVVLELTERQLTTDPAGLLRTVRLVRSLGWGVALDDVGAVPASLALLPLVRPDIIKLDLRLVQDRPTLEIAAVMNAVNAEAERSGTVVLAEGIETPAHERTARALGATLGQGWLYGRPAPLEAGLPGLPQLPRAGRSTRRRAPALRPPVDPPRSAFAVAAARRTPRAADKRLLIEVSKHLEAQARGAGESAVVISTFQDAGFFTPLTRERYARLAAGAAFVGALGAGMPVEPMPGVRGGLLTVGDPLLGEWDVAVLGPHFAACLVARDLGETGPDMQRQFEFVLSHDREVATEVADALMSRIRPAAQVVG